MAMVSTLSLHAADIAEIRSVIADRVDGSRAVGIVVGVIDEKGRQVAAAGKVSLDGTQQPDGDTVYEIGSVTKVFTSLILADMIEKGEVKPDDPVPKFLPPAVKVPSHNGRQITLLDIYRASTAQPVFAIHSYPVEKKCPISRNLKECMSGVLSQAQESFEKSLSKTTVADLVRQIREKAQ